MAKKLKWSGLAVLAVVLSGSLLACGGGGGGAKGGKILIGGALCLTGIQAPLDEPSVRGAQLAVEEINIGPKSGLDGGV
jgi:ABC-type branched-subunit amino acid transport system substrate-binding protein